MVDPFDISRTNTDGRYPVWSCWILRKGSGGSVSWGGHNAPFDDSLPTGANTVFTDGSVEWVPATQFAALYNVDGNLRYYVPVAGDVTGADAIFPGP